MKVNVIGGNMEKREIDGYVAHIRANNPGKIIDELNLTVDGDYVDMDYTFEDVPFERIRRITGYLVGTVDRFNNAKRAEEKDRVKHDLTSYSLAQL